MSTRMTPSDAASVIRHLSEMAEMDQSDEGRAVVGRVNAHLNDYIKSETAGIINDGGPAFPYTEANGCNDGGPGISMRDYFAAKAMHAIASTPRLEPVGGADGCATMSYQIADAMIKARSEGGAA